MPGCQYCTKHCPTEAGLAQHKAAKHHHPCPSCPSTFKTPQALAQHQADKHAFPCPGCTLAFATREVLREHQRSSIHCFCARCDRPFGDAQALSQHRRDFVHAPPKHPGTEYHCCDCKRSFVCEQALLQHLADKVHKPPPPPTTTAANPFECQPCARTFPNAKARDQHLASLVHNPISDIPCPGSEQCGKTFKSFSAALLHFESGMCPGSGVDREVLNLAVLAGDEDGLISERFSGGILGGRVGDADDDDSSTAGSLVVYTPDTSSTPSGVPLSPGDLMTPDSSSVASTALVPSRNPRRCVLCPRTRAPFRTLRDLEQHLASPFHDARIFHCPAGLFGPLGGKKGVVRRFKTLSGLAQHLESGACEGGRGTLRRAVEEVERRLVGMGILWEGVRLLL